MMMALPGFSPPVKAGTAVATVEVAAAAKAEPIEDRPITNACSEQAWPYYAPSCLQDRSPSAGQARTVRLVTTDRLPK